VAAKDGATNPAASAASTRNFFICFLLRIVFGFESFATRLPPHECLLEFET
jgi:hypothetical protein